MLVYAKKEINKPVTPSVKKLIKEEQEDKIENISEDKQIYWADVKKIYPDIAEKIKSLFGGKDKISVGDLRKILLAAEKEDKFWLSEDVWNGAQTTLMDVYRKPQEVIQLNIGSKLIEEIKKDKIMDGFFISYSELMKSAGHPVHSQTIAWARVYKFTEYWVVEELQSDLFGATPKLKDITNGAIEKILEKYTDEEKRYIENFWIQHFTDWDRKLLAVVISLARKSGVRDIWLFDEDASADIHPGISSSKLDRFYKVVPRDLGFKRDKLEVGSKSFSAWHRAVAKLKKV